jgi:ferredoxin-NADP reductase
MEICLALVSPARLQFQAGQFVSLLVGVDRSGRERRRCYSIASRSDRGESLRFIVRSLSAGDTADFWNALPLGAELEMTGPDGCFVLDEHHAGDVLFAATGTGLAPVLPMLCELARRREPGRRHVYWGVRNERDLAFLDEVVSACDSARATLHVYLSQPGPEWSGPRGRITNAVLEALPQLTAPTFYVVGHGAMIDELKRGLVARGVDRQRQIRTEGYVG